ncbi:hypothetical protein [Primorskyibacter sp. S87]|uniref:hypothetical protein n=1 Tax=Primorskyibacter sp. S87 TaxID=3415126 RepID=UPI003C7C11AD
MKKLALALICLGQPLMAQEMSWPYCIGNMSEAIKSQKGFASSVTFLMAQDAIADERAPAELRQRVRVDAAEAEAAIHTLMMGLADYCETLRK